MFKVLVPLLMMSTAFAGHGDGYRVGTLFKVVPESRAHTFTGTTRDHDFDQNSIKVLVWNIKKTQENGWKEEFTSYGKEKDLFLIQEAYQNELFNSSLEKLDGFRWDMGVSFLYRRDNDTATGNMIGANVEPRFVKVRHTEDNEPVMRTPKATTFAKYAIEGLNKEMLVISIHGINLTSFNTFKRHLEQIRTEIVKHDGPVLFAGDFNTRTKKRMQHLESFVNELGLKTVSFENGDCRMKFKFTPYYLDHGFVRDLQVKKAWVDCNSRGSDHKPMFLEMAATTY